MVQIKTLDFKSQTIYVGLDVHLKNWKVSILLEDLVYKTFSQPPSPSALKSYLSKHFPGASYKSVYEAGFCGYWIHDELTGLGIENIVVNPADVPTTDKERQQKTDKRDALKLAKSLRSGQLEAIYIPSRLMLEHRSLLRHRDTHVKDLTRTKNRIKAHLHFFGIKLPEQYSKCNWSNNFIRWIEEQQMQSEVGQDVLSSLLVSYRQQRKRLLAVNRLLRELSKTPAYEKNVELLLSIPGIGLIGAMKILLELGDIKRFRGLERLCAYIGLIPRTNSSGEHERVGEMTNRGNRQLKKMLVEASWVAIRNDPAMALKYQQLCKRMKAQKAIIKIARKLLNRIRFVLLNQQKYQTGKA